MKTKPATEHINRVSLKPDWKVEYERWCADRKKHHIRIGHDTS